MSATIATQPRPPLPARFLDLDGRSVFVTGGGSGIGAAITDEFLAQGARVAFVQRSDAAGFCDAMEQKHGARPYFQSCDVTDIAALHRSLENAATRHGPIRILVNNAANDQRHSTREVTEEFWKWSTDINLKSYFFAGQAVLEPMQAEGGGAIINLSSVAYMMGMAGFPIYSSSNAAIVALTQSWAREFGAGGVRVNAVAPGMVITPRQQELWLTPEGVRDHVARQCIPNPLVPADIAGAVMFLASDASRMMTGQTLIVDGGFIARS